MSFESIQYGLYRRELLRYISTLSIKFSPFAELVEKHVRENTNHNIADYTENPYYRNLHGEYSCIDTAMSVWSIEEDKSVTFNKQLWEDYPQTASLYTIGSEAYKRLCLTYPNQVGLIKGIMYPIPDIHAAYNAPEFTILQHHPEFLQTNEQETILTATKRCLEYLRDRWYIYDYGHEDQYWLVFMSQLYLNLFTCLLKQRLENQDTSAVHSLHVWDRLEANGLGPYRSILNAKQARWFYRNMAYLKENRGRKSNLILLADNLLNNLKVHLVGKRFFQQSADPTNECIIIPEALSEEIVDYSINIPEPIATTSTVRHTRSRAISETIGSKEAVTKIADFLRTTDVSSNSTTTPVNMNSKESMDYILRRVHVEGYYPAYSVDNSVLKEERFGRTVLNNYPTRLLEFQKYTVHAPYLRHMTHFLFDSLLYLHANDRLQYSLSFLDENTNVIVELSIENALALLHYVLYRQYGIIPKYLPRLYPARKAYQLTTPKKDKLPTHFHFNGYNYQIKSIIKASQLLTEIPWTHNKKFHTPADFIQHLGKQFAIQVKHLREVWSEMHLTHQWAMWWYYQHITVRENISLREKDVTYTEWIASAPGVQELITGYEKLADSNEYYRQFAEGLLRKLIPVELSDDLIRHAGPIFDDTRYYDELKKLFVGWTSHDLTYLDTDRTPITYLELIPITGMTGDHSDEQITEIVDAGITRVTTGLSEQFPYDFTEPDNKPVLIDVVQSEKDYIDCTSLQIHLRENKPQDLSDYVVYEDSLQIIDIQAVESEASNLRLPTNITLIGATIPEGSI